MPRYHVRRSTQIDASPENVFATVADFRSWTSWSPWLCSEPDAQVDVTEDSSSVGSIYSWKGEIVGEGEIEHRKLDPGRLIEEEIRFVKPFRSQAQVAFELAPVGGGTKITWHMRGSLPWFLFWMRSQMKVFIGMDYERGLKMLKEWIESGQVCTKTRIKGVESIGPLRMAGIRQECSIGLIGPSMEAALKETMQKLSDGNVPTDGEPISVYHKFDMKAQILDYTSGLMVAETADIPTAMSSWSIPAMKALTVEHVGSYEHLGNAWSAAHQFARYKKLKQSKVGTFEVYKNNPHDTSPSDLRTEIFIPLK